MITRLANALFGNLPNDATKYYDGTGAFSIPAGGSSPWDIDIEKSADQVVTNSATLVDDSELQFSTAAGPSYWEINACLIYSASVGADDFKVAYAVAAGTMFGVPLIGLITAANAAQLTTIAVIDAAVSASVVAGAGTLNNLNTIFIHGFLKFTNNTTFKIQFAANSASGSNTATMRQGSTLRAKRIF